MFQAGGATIVVLIICLLILVGIAVERYKYYRVAKVNNEDFIEQLKIMMRQKKWQYAIELCKSDESLIAKVAEAGIEASINQGTNISAIIEGKSAVILADLKKNLAYLDMMVTVAPIIGLLGTVLGVIQKLSGQEEQTLAVVAGGIAGALVSTAFGLFVALVAILMYTYFNRQLERMMNDVSRVSAMIVAQAQWEEEEN